MRVLFYSKSAKLLGVSALLAAGLWAGQAAAAITGSKHDLTFNGNTYYTSTASAEICAFCHTPHGGQSAAPLWNRVLPAAGGFSVYTSDTLDGTIALTGANSLACLSCHDGVGSLDVVVNAPGSGGYNTGGTTLGYTWNGGNTTIGAGVTQIGTSLTDDHPVALPYCGGGGASGCVDTDFKAVMKDGVAVPIANFGNGAGAFAAGTKWWVETGGNSTRSKTDLVLYLDGSNVPNVQCASCHEPHNGGAAGTPFLRFTNAQSQLCLSCHAK